MLLDYPFAESCWRIIDKNHDGSASREFAGWLERSFARWNKDQRAEAITL